MRISDWSSDVCSSDLATQAASSREEISAKAVQASATDLSPSGSNPSYLGEYHAPAGACRASQATEGRSSCLASSSIACARWPRPCRRMIAARSEEHTSELQSLMRISYAVFCLKKKKKTQKTK